MVEDPRRIGPLSALLALGHEMESVTRLAESVAERTALVARL